MEIIHIKFGHPTSFEEQGKLSDRAVHNDYPLEEALCFEFESLLDSLIKKKGNESFFDLVFFVSVGKQVKAPKIHFATYMENGHKLPMMVINGSHLKTADSELIPITDHYIDELGQLYQDEFDYEYVGFERDVD